MVGQLRVEEHNDKRLGKRMQELVWAIIFVPAIWHAIHHYQVRECFLLYSRLFQLHPKVNKDKGSFVEKDKRENRESDGWLEKSGEREEGGCVRYLRRRDLQGLDGGHGGRRGEWRIEPPSSP